MKIIIKKEFDGRNYIGTCENIPGCYVQAQNEDKLKINIMRALKIIKQSCAQRNQPFPNGKDRPLFDVRIRFDSLSTDKLVRFFESRNYHIEYIDEKSVLLLNSDFPFNYVHLPRFDRLSPLLIQKIFGKENTIHIDRKGMKLSTSVS